MVINVSMFQYLVSAEYEASLPTLLPCLDHLSKVRRDLYAIISVATPWKSRYREC